MGIFTIYKPIGKTPLEVVNELKTKDSTINKISYAGRLDPMADGELLVLTNEDCSKQNTYHNCDKMYEFDLLLGIETDTYDILGIIKDNKLSDFNIEKIIKYIEKLEGTHLQSYPPYSSVRVNGKPLWHYAKTNTLATIEIPCKKITIKSIEIKNKYNISKSELLEYVNAKINLLDKDHDFRQSIIQKEWNNITEANYPVFTIQVHVSSGTYIRELCNTIGKQFNISTLALKIKRLRVFY